MWMGVGRIQQSWDCSKYHLMVLSHLLPNAERAGSLPKSAEAEKTWCCSESKALFNPGAEAAVLSYLMPCLAMSPWGSAPLPAVPPRPWPRAFSQIHPERATTESQSNPGSNPLGGFRQFRSPGGVCSSDVFTSCSLGMDPRRVVIKNSLPESC